MNTTYKTKTNTVTRYDLGSAVCEGTHTEQEIHGNTSEEILRNATLLDGDFFVGGFHVRSNKVWHGGWFTFEDVVRRKYFAERLEDQNQAVWLKTCRVC
jgi:hypothetical protein